MHDQRLLLTRVKLQSRSPLTPKERETIRSILTTHVTRGGTAVVRVHPSGRAPDSDAGHVAYTDVYTFHGPETERLAEALTEVEAQGPRGLVATASRPTVWDATRHASEFDGFPQKPPRSSWMAALPRRVMVRGHERGVIRMNPISLKLEGDALRLPAERQEGYRKELEALRLADPEKPPMRWLLSPVAVRHYILGGVRVDTKAKKILERPKGELKAHEVEITPKFKGDTRLVELAISTLASDRALLLIGEPGTAKSWLSEHLTAAICGDSTLVIQGTAGTTEEQIKYGWNYARLLAQGPSQEALRPSPVFHAMADGKIARIEEITRCPPEVQDSLISILSEKVIAVPELGGAQYAAPGFSVIATANTRDRGVNEMSAALKRRFNTVILPLPRTVEIEAEIVLERVERLGTDLKLTASPPAPEAVRRVVQLFRELRSGKAADGTAFGGKPSSVLSTAEAISTITTAMSIASGFGSGASRVTGDRELAEAIVSTVVRDDVADLKVLASYLKLVMSKRPDQATLAREMTSMLKDVYGASFAE